MKRTPRLVSLAVLAPLLAIAGPALADIGPKPTMSFTIVPDATGLSIATAELLQCAKADCSDAAPLKRLGPQAFGCTALTCRALAYGFADFGELRITFSDRRTLTSNVFKPNGFNATYHVDVHGSVLRVRSP
jgi:hypothetical protein